MERWVLWLALGGCPEVVFVGMNLNANAELEVYNGFAL